MCSYGAGIIERDEVAPPHVQSGEIILALSPVPFRNARKVTAATVRCLLLSGNAVRVCQDVQGCAGSREPFIPRILQNYAMSCAPCFPKRTNSGQVGPLLGRGDRASAKRLQDHSASLSESRKKPRLPTSVKQLRRSGYGRYSERRQRPRTVNELPRDADCCC